MKRLITYTLLTAFLFTGFSLNVNAEVASQWNLHGFAWSWNTGWIKLSSKKIDLNGNVTNENDNNIQYGITFKESGSDLLTEGYAWSPNVGWISFNQADLNTPTGFECKSANNAPAIPAKLVQSGSDYVLKGTARVISPIQTPLGISALYWHGNWNGCIYFDHASMPYAGGCNVLPGVTFKKDPTSDAYKGAGFAWNAGGSTSGAPSCAGLAGLGFGGLSYIDFKGTAKAQALLIKEETELAVNIDISSWDGLCKSTTGGDIAKTIAINYAVSPASGTTCQLVFDGTQYNLGDSDNNLPASGVGTKYITFTPNSESVSASISCTNLSVKAPTTKIATDTITCAECSNFKDDADSDSDVDEDDLSCRVACTEDGDYTPGSNEEIKEGEGINNCEKEPTTKGLPKIKEN